MPVKTGIQEDITAAKKIPAYAGIFLAIQADHE
jgi:hypothetical protein